MNKSERLKKIELDEVELYYNILNSKDPDLINKSTSEEIASIISANFNVDCNGRDVFLIHEPTLEDIIIDSEIHYGLLNNY